MYEQHVTHTEFAKTQKRVEELEAKVEDGVKRLKTLLDKFGGHTADCAIRGPNLIGGDGKGWRRAKCDCGWEEARVQK